MANLTRSDSTNDFADEPVTESMGFWMQFPAVSDASRGVAMDNMVTATSEIEVLGGKRGVVAQLALGASDSE